jgi:hypothetical protein
MKKQLYVLSCVLLSLSSVFAQRTATQTATNFLVSGGQYSFDIYCQSTGATPVRVGLTSFYFTCNTAAMNAPVLSNVNSKYTAGSATGDYDAMTCGTAGGSVFVSINYAGLGSGTGDLLSTSGPMGERICTVSLTITNPAATASLAWDAGNSGMVTPGFQIVAPTYVGTDNSPLPVELGSFTATCNRLSAELKWSTVTEVSNYGFEIERRAEFGKDAVWSKIGFVAGNGSSNTPHDYRFTDAGLPSGRFAYRLKQVDLDGTFKYYKTTEVEVGLAAKELTLSNNYPNPFNPSTNIEFTLPSDGRAVLKVYSILGQEVAELFDGEAQAGRIIQARFDATGVSTGLYFYQLQFGGKTLMKRMLLVK